jgi:hypothetical protein
VTADPNVIVPVPGVPDTVIFTRSAHPGST